MSKGIRIGINLLAFQPGRSGGGELYVRHLIRALSRVDQVNQYVLFTNLDNSDKYPPPGPNFVVDLVRIKSLPQWRRIAVEQSTLPLLVHRHKLSVLHSPSYTAPLLARVPSVISIFDMLYKTHPEFIEQPKLAFWRVVVPVSARQAKRVITISEHAGRDLQRYLGLAASKIVVTPLAGIPMEGTAAVPGSPRASQIMGKYGISPPYFLTVAGLGKHKNAITIVRALGRLHDQHGLRSTSLVITGKDYGASAEIMREIRRLGLGDRVVLTGYADAADMPTLYAGASAYVSVSRFEGFGLTVLEAMECGAPVIVSDCGSLPEVAGSAAVIVKPDDVVSLSNEMRSFVTDVGLRRDYAARGALRCKHFSWDTTARLTIEAYRAAVGVAPSP